MASLAHPHPDPAGVSLPPVPAGFSSATADRAGYVRQPSVHEMLAMGRTWNALADMHEDAPAYRAVTADWRWEKDQ